MYERMETGRLKAIWIAATNPVVSLPDIHSIRRALASGRISPIASLVISAFVLLAAAGAVLWGGATPRAAG